jgi:hypothetical protein
MVPELVWKTQALDLSSLKQPFSRSNIGLPVLETPPTYQLQIESRKHWSARVSIGKKRKLFAFPWESCETSSSYYNGM